MRSIWKYIKRYWIWAILAPIAMVGEVAMDLIQPQLMAEIVDEGVLGLSNGGVSNLDIVLTTGRDMILWCIFGATCGVLSGVFANLCCQPLGGDLREEAFRRIMSLSFAQTNRFSTGSLVTRITNDITQIQNMVMQCIRGSFRTLLLFLGGIGCMLMLDLSFGVVIACALPLVAGCSWYFLRKTAPLFTVLQERLDRVNSVMQENVTGARVVKAYVREGYEEERFDAANEELIGTQLHILELFATMTPLLNIVLNVSVVAVIYVGGLRVQSGGATPGTVMAAITYVSQIMNAVLRMAMIFQTLSRGFASARRVEEVINCTPSIGSGSFDGKTDLRGQVELRDVSFAYPDGSGEPVLRHVSLTVRPGETLGIMGATGCGKSSLVQLIPRFYDATEGTVLVDGVDVREYDLHALRDKVAIALQKSDLFSTTLGENIRWGREDATQEELEEAAEVAQAAEFIHRKSDGFDTPVAEKGMSLSGGQKQRIAISRAVLKDAEILIFDDATSALDLKTEAELYTALNRKKGNVTKIIVAQRVASVQNADRIALLEEGRLIACASHRELLRTCPVYRDICRSQGKEGEQVG
ncbi:MAG: ABC transporter ATP-binding protein/permease [Clostridiales bacterium]|nr:ABC transporter ATP-binding protein/permease [Clostridiales bacterium]